MKIDVLIPSYGRPQSLRRLLLSLESSLMYVNRVVIVYRSTDLLTLREIEDFGHVGVAVHSSGVINALLRGSVEIESDFVAVFDDDVVLTPDWFQRMIKHVESGAGAAGGRDVVTSNPSHAIVKKIGLISIFGRIIGNHHQMTIGLQSVDHLKGCNYIIKSEYLKSPSQLILYLKGSGAQYGNDTVFTIWPRSKGELIIFDPDATVNHYAEERPDDDKRFDKALNARYIYAFNIWLILLSFMPARSLPICITYNLLVGNFSTPGLVWSLWRNRYEPLEGFRILIASYRACLDAIKIARRYRSGLPKRKQLSHLKYD